MTPRVLVKWATRSRPKLVLERLPLWLVDNSVSVLMSIDEDDAACNCPAFTVPLFNLSGGRVTLRIGNSKGKVEAINDGLADEPWDVLIVGADDITPIRTDYGRYLAGLLLAKWPDGDGVIQCDDGRARNPLCATVPVMGRKFFDRTGWAYCPEYTSLWCDNDLAEYAAGLGKLCYLDKTVLRHDWIDVTGRDELHTRNESFYWQDYKVYEARKAAGFPAAREDRPCPPPSLTS